MSTASRPAAALPTPVKRLLYCAAAFALFIGVSAALAPDKSLAQARQESEQSRLVQRTQQVPLGVVASIGAPGTTIRTADQIRMSLPTTRPLIGTLTGSPYYIWVYAGQHGPVYTVADKRGRILATEVSADDLYQQVPDASVRDLQLIPNGAVMLADPARQSELPER
jgi:hypothetical protein